MWCHESGFLTIVTFFGQKNPGFRYQIDCQDDYCHSFERPIGFSLTLVMLNQFRMTEDKPLLFLCSGSEACDAAKPAQLLARELVSRGMGEIADLTRMLKKEVAEQFRNRKMIFLNDCKGSCIKMIIEKINPAEDRHVYVDLCDVQESFDPVEYLTNHFFLKKLAVA
jgi:uncharacterized metal-binding protein